MKTIETSKLGFYTTVQASRIAQVPQWTLINWKRNGVIVPTVSWVDELGKNHLGHSFESVVFTRLLRLLRDKGISLYKAVGAMQQVRRRFGPPSQGWSAARIFVDKRDAYVYEEKDRDSWGVTIATRYNQKLAEFAFGEEFLLLKDRADALLIPAEFLNSVEIDPTIQNGLPIVLDTKILTRTIHDLNSQGYQYTDIRDMYPFIALEKIRGAEAYESFLDKAAKAHLN